MTKLKFIYKSAENILLEKEIIWFRSTWSQTAEVSINELFSVIPKGKWL